MPVFRTQKTVDLTKPVQFQRGPSGPQGERGEKGDTGDAGDLPPGGTSEDYFNGDAEWADFDDSVSASPDVVANTAKVSADGSVTTHNDITDPGSGIIISDAERVNLGNQSGVNTGDQDLSGLAEKSNVLELDNTTPFTPDQDYEPSTKKYVDDGLGDKQDTLTFDAVPTDASTNPVESNGIFDALGLKVNISDIIDNLTTTDTDKPLSANQGKILKDLITLLEGSLIPQGAWDADTNTPTLPGAATTGQFWIVSVAGNTDLDGITDWNVNDWAVKTASGWAKVDNTDKVLSVAGKTGVVTLDISDIIGLQTELDAIHADIDNERAITKEPTGFFEPKNIIVTYDSTARTITLTGTVQGYWRGVQIPALVSGWESAAHDTGDGTYYLYYNGTAFVWSATLWVYSDLHIARVLVMNSGAVVIAFRECHGFQPAPSHHNDHQNIGTWRTDGTGLIPDTSYALDSTAPADRRPDINLCELHDEDLLSSLPALTTNLYSWWYRSGTDTVNVNNDHAEIINLSGNQPYWNENNGGNWQQTLFQNNHYGKIFIIAVPVTAEAGSQKYRYIFVQPQETSLTLAGVQAVNTFSLDLGGFIDEVKEMVFIAEVIIQYTASNWVVKEVNPVLGSRATQVTVSGSAAGAVAAHEALPDPHPGYLLLAGRAGGQEISGKVSLLGPLSKATFIKTASYTLLADDPEEVLFDPASSGQVLSLPASPSDGECRSISMPGAASNSSEIDRNGKLLLGGTDNINLFAGEVVNLKYYSSSGSWELQN